MIPRWAYEPIAIELIPGGPGAGVLVSVTFTFCLIKTEMQSNVNVNKFKHLHVYIARVLGVILAYLPDMMRALCGFHSICWLDKYIYSHSFVFVTRPLRYRNIYYVYDGYGIRNCIWFVHVTLRKVYCSCIICIYITRWKTISNWVFYFPHEGVD